MSRPLKVGFLLPYSGMYPFYGQHLMAGIACALTKNKIAATQFNFIPAYVGNGAQAKCVEEAKRLLFFEGVDILMGMVSIKVIEDLKPMLQNFNKLGFFIDFGEYIATPATSGDNIFNLSMNLWQSQYALGKWAVKEFGPAGQLVMPIYEAGFNLSSSFTAGAAAAGSTGVNSFVLPENYASNAHLDLSPFFEALEKETPNFVHAIFTGKMANQFLWQWRQSKFYDTVPLVVAENMAYNEALFEVESMNIKMYSARSWHRTMQNKENKAFVKQFEDFGKQDANVFAMLGYEAGLSLAVMLPQLSKNDGAEAVHLFNKKGVEGPRGLIVNNDSQHYNYHPIDIVKIQTATPRTLETILACETAIGFDTTEVIENTQSGWLNPLIAV